MKSFKFILAMMIAFVCFSSCSSDDDDLDTPTKGSKRIKSINYSGYYHADFSYENDRVSKITIKMIGDFKKGEVMTLSYKYESNQVIETLENDIYDMGGRIQNTYELENGLAVKARVYDNERKYQYSSGYMVKIYVGTPDESDFIYDKNGNLLSSPFNDNITYSKIENKGNIWFSSLYDTDTRDLHYYLGIFGKSTKYLPEKDSYYSYTYTLDSDKYIKEVRIKDNDDDSESWTETYTYEVVQ